MSDNITLEALAAVDAALGGMTCTGFTRHVIAESDVVTLDLMVRPDTDLDSRFRAWDRDALEFVAVNGWLFSIDDAEA